MGKKKDLSCEERIPTEFEKIFVSKLHRRFTDMSKLFVILLSAVIVATGSATQKDNGKNPVLSLMMGLRAEVEKLASKVDGINSHVGELGSKVEEVNCKIARLNPLVQKFDNISVDMASVKKSLTGDPFSSCTGDIITVTGTTIKYPLSGTYGINENCHWTVNAGNNVTVFFTKFDVGMDSSLVEITQNDRRLKLWYGG